MARKARTASKDSIEDRNGFVDAAYRSGPIEEHAVLAAAGYRQLLRVDGSAAPAGRDAQLFHDKDAGTPDSGAAVALDHDGPLENDRLAVAGGSSAGAHDIPAPDSDGASGDALSGSAPAPVSGADVRDGSAIPVSGNAGDGAPTLDGGRSNPPPTAAADPIKAGETEVVRGAILANRYEAYALKSGTGTDEGERLFGTPDGDTIDALGGDDVVFGLAGDDLILGGDGNDFASGDADNDVIDGGSHDDALMGGEGNDELYGQTGNDQLFGESGDDRLLGHEGDDSLDGGDGDDKLAGGDGDDSLSDFDGANSLSGGAGNDHIAAGSADGVQRIDGGDGDDTIRHYLRYHASSIATGSGSDSIEILHAHLGKAAIVVTDFTTGDKGDVFRLSGGEGSLLSLLSGWDGSGIL